MSCPHVTRVFEAVDVDDGGIVQEYFCAECGHAWMEHATSFEAIEREAIERSLEVTRKRRELGLGVRT